MKNKLYGATSFLVLAFILTMAIPSTVCSQTVTVGTGTGVSVFSPINRTNDYCIYEIIYLASDIGLTGYINKFAFQKNDGSDGTAIDSVTIYMKHTTQTFLGNDFFSTTGYTLVYSGPFPNDPGFGWREVTLSTPFGYNGISNLQVLTTKGYQAAMPTTIGVIPRWMYTDITPDPDRARRYYGDSAVSQARTLTSINYSANARLDFGIVGIVEIVPGVVSVYPNPSNGDISFRLNRDLKYDESRLIIYSSLGDAVFHSIINRDEEILVTHLQPGVYFYELTGDENNKVATGKLVVLD